MIIKFLLSNQNYNQNRYTHESDIIKSKGEILCNVAHIRKKYYHYM